MPSFEPPRIKDVPPVPVAGNTTDQRAAHRVPPATASNGLGSSHAALETETRVVLITLVPNHVQVSMGNNTLVNEATRNSMVHMALIHNGRR